MITNDRPLSLSRLLASLHAASYFGDNVDLRINVEQSADLDTQRIIQSTFWPFGRVTVHRRIVHGGLMPAVVEAWYPSTNDSYGLLLEDDVEVSPLFFAYTKLALLKYRYGSPSNRDPSLFGISLYQQKNVELRLEGRRPFYARALFAANGIEPHDTPYLSPIPCSWGVPSHITSQKMLTPCRRTLLSRALARVSRLSRAPPR